MLTGSLCNMLRFKLLFIHKKLRTVILKEYKNSNIPMFWIQVKTYLQKVDGQFWDSGLCAGSARPGRQSDLARSKKANQSHRLTRSDLTHSRTVL